MADKRNVTIPDFKQPDEDNLFLASRHGLRTYKDLHAFQDFFLQFLIDFEHDLSKPIGFLADSSDELIFAIASCWKLGLPFVCFNPNAGITELEENMLAIQPGLVFVDEAHRELVRPDNRIKMEQLSLERTLKVETELGTEAKKYKPATKPDDVFGYFFTSGSTGTPKIVPLKRRQMLFAAYSSADNFRPRPNHFWLLCLPLYHIGGISIILRSILYGSGIYRMNRFDEHMISTFLTENTMFQAASLVPTMLKRLMEIPAFRTHKNFQAILLGGGPIDQDMLKEAHQRGIPLVSSYGMTETCAQIAANPLTKPSGLYVPIKSVGTLFSPNEIQIRDEDNNKVGPNTSGTIWLRGPQVFDGYFSKETPSHIDEAGWFNTGDYGHINVNNQLFIESRRTDLIITGGENVSPFEVESELEKIEPIREAAVFGLADKEWGQKVVAVVVARTKEKIEADEIRNKLKERITSYKVPKEIIQAETLPRTQTGKVIRDELAKLFKTSA